MKRTTIVMIGLVMILFLLPMTAFAADSSNGSEENVDARNYSYKITPLLPPFNSYFFVETDNPNPKSFRFEDKSSKYRSRPYILMYADTDNDPKIFADVHYENEETGRVDGGYIFYGGGTDGGEVSLLVSDKPDAYYPTYEDTGKRLTLPRLKNSLDYLIDTYATKGSFFDNMDAVQTALRSIAIYSESTTIGTLAQDKDYWMLGVSDHVDQSIYKYSPYERQEERPLFASAIYPYKLDSLGFPGMMGSVAEALDSTAQVSNNSQAHYNVDVTYNGVTRTYGGAGGMKGQGILEDQIQPYFSFGSNGTEITMDGVYDILWHYSKLNIPYDVPREGELSFDQIYDTVGTGAWAKVSSGGKNPDNPAYAYLYQDGDGTNFRGGYFDPGHEYYISGDLACVSDAWVDGRYVDDREKFIPGETFDDHPTSDILLKDVEVPQVAYTTSYVYNEETKQYEPVHEKKGLAKKVTKTVLFKYQDGIWIATGIDEGGDYADYEIIKELTFSRQLDPRFYPMTYLDADKVKSLSVDANTNSAPDKGFIYDGTAYPGTPFDHQTRHCWDYGKTVKDARCGQAGERKYTCEVCGATRSETIPAPEHKWDEDYWTERNPTCSQEGIKSTFCMSCGEYRRVSIPALGHKWGEATYTITRDYRTVTATRTCENDNSHVEREIVETVPIVTVQPTCEEAGEMIYRATFKNPAFTPKKRTEAVPALGHDWDKGVITLAPTAASNGQRTFSCSRCDAVRTESIPRDLDEITPSEQMADAAAVDESIPIVNTGRISTVGSVSKKQMKVKFPIDPAVDNYQIQYRTSRDGQWTDAWSAGTDTYIIKGLKQYSLCEFRIAGYVKEEDGLWARGSWSASSFRYMNGVRLKTAKAGKKKIKVTWAKDPGCSGYQIQYSLKKNMSKAKTITVKGKSKTKYTIKKLKKGKKYYIKVRPIKNSGGRTYIGILSKAKKVKVKK